MRSIKQKSVVGLMSMLTLIAVASSKYSNSVIDQLIYTQEYKGDFYINNLSANSLNNTKKNKVYFEKQNGKMEKMYARDFYKNIKYDEVQLASLPREDSEIYSLIKDHTVKLSMPCQSGTGWILDFEIPKEKNAYPTKWFFATNSHVISHYRFNSNPYNVELPINLNRVFYNYQKEKNRSVFRFFENLNDDQHEIKSSYESGCGESIRNKSAYINVYKENSNYKWSNGSNGSNWFHWFAPSFPSIIEEKEYLTTKIKDPKLFFVANNFLGPRYKKDGTLVKNTLYKKDFSVVEINFPSQNTARLITNNFYGKYYAHTEEETKKDNVKLFQPELMSAYTNAELKKLGKFYVGGYPGRADEKPAFDMNTRWNLDTRKLEQSKLSHANWDIETEPFALLNKHKEMIWGHLDLKKLNKTSPSDILNWDTKNLNSWGYMYILDKAFLQQGASGSMVLDKNKKLYGLYTMNNPLFNHGFVEPIRSEGLVYERKIILPKYDLIKGTENQTISYKSQLDKYYPGIKTYLRSKNWKD